MALQARRPFAVAPCCVFSGEFPERSVGGKHVESLNDLVEWMLAKHPRMRTAMLPFAGRNKVCYMLPADYVEEDAAAT